LKGLGISGPWIQVKPWCTGKQLPLGFNPTGPKGEIMRESKYTFLYRSQDGHIMRPENFLNINKGRTLSSSQLRVLGITKIKNEAQAASVKLQATSCKKQLHTPGKRVKNRFNRKR
jgi:hypothetical protein